MRSLLVVMLVVSANALAAEPTPRKSTDLIVQLGSANYQEREAAFQQLDQMGKDVLGDLHIALASPDSEIARRAAELIRKIEQRQIASDRLAPTMVEFAVADKSVFEALAVFSRATGISLAPRGDVAKLRERRISFKTDGKVPVWTAFDQFVRAANIQEWDGVTPMFGLKPTIQSESGQFVQINNARFRASGNIRSDMMPPKEIFVFDGTASAIPTIQAGALRIRALPAGTQISTNQPDPDELIVPLQITIEPKLFWQSNPTVKHAVAVDQNGQRLSASVISSVGPRDPYEDFGGAFMFRDASMTMTNPQRSQYVGLRFRRGNEPTKTLKELNGTLSLPFRIDGELLHSDAPAQAAGKTIRASNGASMTIASATRTDNDEFKMELSIDLPNDVWPSGFNFNNFNSNAAWQGGMLGGGQQMTTSMRSLTNTGDYFGLRLLDAKGEKISLKNARDETVTSGSEGMKIKTTLFAKLAKDAPEPARLIFRASYTTSVEAAFTFRDIATQ